MRRILAAAAIAVALGTAGAQAQERVGDAALGAGAGALVLGPVGAAAGAVIGYTAGPAIARSWGIGGRKRRHARHAARPKPAAARQAASTSDAEPRKPGKRGGWYNINRQ
jgi:hypothetical protein